MTKDQKDLLENWYNHTALWRDEYRIDMSLKAHEALNDLVESIKIAQESKTREECAAQIKTLKRGEWENMPERYKWPMDDPFYSYYMKGFKAAKFKAKQKILNNKTDE